MGNLSRIVIFTVLLSLVSGVYAQDEKIDYILKNYIEINGLEKQGSNLFGLESAENGNIIIGFSWHASSQNGGTISYGGKNITNSKDEDIVGNTDGETSTIASIMVAEIDKNLDIVWKAYSINGAVEQNNTFIHRTSDNGIVLCVTSSPNNTKEAHSSTFFDFYDSSEQLISIAHPSPKAGKRSKRATIVKLDSNGKYLWHRLIDGDSYVEVGGQAVYSDKPFTLNDFVIDANDNMYLCGYVNTSIKFMSSDMAYRTYAGVANMSSYSGDNNKSGDLFIAKFDKDGYFVDCIQGDGNIYNVFSRANRLLIDNSYLYALCELVKSDEYRAEAIVKVDLASFKQSSDFVCELMLDNNSKENCTFNIGDFKKVGDVFYISGGLYGNLHWGEISVLPDVDQELSKQDGFLVKIDTKNNKVSGFNYGAPNTKMTDIGLLGDRIFLLAHRMQKNDATPGLSAEAGVYVIDVDKELKNPSSALLISTEMSVVSTAIFRKNTMLLFARRNNKEADVYNADSSATQLTLTKTGGFNIVLLEYEISGLKDDGNALIGIPADKKHDPYYYDLNGRKVSSPTRGIYINGGKLVHVK